MDAKNSHGRRDVVAWARGKRLGLNALRTATGERGQTDKRCEFLEHGDPLVAKTRHSALMLDRWAKRVQRQSYTLRITGSSSLQPGALRGGAADQVSK